METDAEQDMSVPYETGDEGAVADEGDDSGTGAAVALLVAFLAFVAAVALVILRHLLFQA